MAASASDPQYALIEVHASQVTGEGRSTGERGDRG
jgi:hypothetical protein